MQLFFLLFAFVGVRDIDPLLTRLPFVIRSFLRFVRSGFPIVVVVDFYTLPSIFDLSR